MVEVGDGLWAIQSNVTGLDTVEYKFLSSADWADSEEVPAECGADNGLGAFNRSMLPSGGMTTLPVVCFSSCSECQGDGGSDPDGPGDSVDGSVYCGPGTVWDDQLQVCVALASCAEDINGDGLVSVSDVLALLSEFGSVCP